MTSVVDLIQAEGIAKGKAEGKAEMMITLVRDGLLARAVAELRLRHLCEQGALPAEIVTEALRRLAAD